MQELTKYYKNRKKTFTLILTHLSVYTGTIILSCTLFRSHSMTNNLKIFSSLVNFCQKYESISFSFRLKFCSKIETSPWGQKIKVMSLSSSTSYTTSISQQRKNRIAINILQLHWLIYIFLKYICIFICMYTDSVYLMRILP